MIYERLLVIIILALVGTGAFTALKQVHVQRLNRRTPRQKSDGRPTLLYFRSDSCAVCPTQARFLEQLAGDGENGRFTIQKIDVDTDPDKARQYGIMTLPTTMVLDTAGQVININYGLTPPHKLAKQLNIM